jgi:hypothetical protein
MNSEIKKKSDNSWEQNVIDGDRSIRAKKVA